MFYLLFLSQETKASPKFSIVWSTETHTGATNYLKDSSGQALDAGTAMNGDGYLVEIGYFSEGSFSSPFQENAFLGEWIPLTVNTRVGIQARAMDSLMVCLLSKLHSRKMQIL